MSEIAPAPPESRAEARLTFAIPYARNLTYLQLAVESVLSQDHPDWHLLVYDDSGSGEARDLVSGMGDSRVDYCANPHPLGMARNWNRCIDAAPTNLVTILHADDQLEPSYACRMLDLAQRQPEATAYFCAATIIDEDGNPAFSLADAVKGWIQPAGGDAVLLRASRGAAAVMRGNFIMCPTLCFRKSRLLERRFSEEWSQVQDLELTTRLLMDGDLLVGSRLAAYRYRRHTESATARQSASLHRFDEEFRLFDRVAERAETLGWKQVVRIARRKTIVRLHLFYLVMRDLAALRAGPARRKLRLLIDGRLEREERTG